MQRKQKGRTKIKKRGRIEECREKRMDGRLIVKEEIVCRMKKLMVIRRWKTISKWKKTKN